MTDSPCISVCTINDETGFCEGCYRSLREIARWPKYSSEQKRDVLAALKKRKPENRLNN